MKKALLAMFFMCLLLVVTGCSSTQRAHVAGPLKSERDVTISYQESSDTRKAKSLLHLGGYFVYLICVVPVLAAL
jgi:predicted component of type VI protein secretion system